MKVFRVVMQGPDGPMKREDGKSVQELRNETSLFAARTFEEVWAHVEKARMAEWAELELIKIEEAAPAIFILSEGPAQGHAPK